VDNQTSLFTIEGRPALRANEAPEADLQIASPDYFRALRISMVRGRAFSEADDANTQRVAVISRSMASIYWPGGDEIGHRLKLGGPESADPWMTIVGVVEDIRQNWWNPPTRPTIYQPFFQAPKTGMVFLMRTVAPPASFATAVRKVVKQIDSGIALSSLDSYETEVSTSIAIIRILGILLGVFGLVALALSSIGVYGVMLESVVQKTREIGIRVALGARPADVMRMVLWRSLRLTGIGVAIGLPLAFLANRTMAKLVLGIVSVDFTMLAGFAVLLAVVGVVAGFFPARRAMRVNPIVALRYE
jgi:putative ABC transport system permease protein